MTRASIFKTAYNACKKEEVKDVLKKFKKHLVKAKLERNYYNKNTKLAEQQRKLVDDNYAVIGGIVALMLLLIIVTIEHKMFTYPIPINR